MKLAREARDSAASVSDPYNKRTFLLIAQRYETMAERVRLRASDSKKDGCAGGFRQT